MKIDLNADLGEGAPTDVEVLPFVSSANVSCGAHAGDEATMRDTIRAARDLGVTVGAHPGYPDRETFGRVSLAMSLYELRASLVEQLDAIAAISEDEHVRIAYCKPHGALYHDAAQGHEIAELIAELAGSRGLALLGLADSELEAAARRAGVPFAAEAFVDRGYDEHGRMIPRGEPGAVLATGAAQRAPSLATRADSLCLHGDTPGAVQTAAEVRSALVDAGYRIEAFA